MTEDHKKIAESIRSGRYFEEARSWYQAMYIGPISERSFFLIIAVLALLTVTTSIFALLSLMPLTTRPGIPIYADARGDEVKPRLVGLREGKEPADEAMVHFYVTRYVAMRESYAAQTYQSNALFIKAHSTKDVYDDYIREFSVSNPLSPAAVLGTTAQRLATPRTVTLSSNTNPGRSKVQFSTEIIGVDTPTKSRWTATIEYIYTGMKIEMVKNPETGKKEMQVTDPQFQVTSYELKEDK